MKGRKRLESVNKIIYKISSYNIRQAQQKRMDNIMRSVSFEKMISAKPINKDILFVMPTIYPHSGGETSILRLSTFLANNGYNVFYSCYDNDNIEEMGKNCRINLKDYKGTFLKISECENRSFDFVISTFWIAAYRAKRIKGYHIYFAQDFEPYFYPLDENYVLAKKVYSMGFHIISLGLWNKEEIIKHTSTKDRIDVIDFPYEPSEYKPIQRDYMMYSGKKNIKLAVYIKNDGKRLPNLIQYNLKCAADELLESYGIKLDVNIFGMNRKEKLLVGNNIGRLSKEQLMQLYCECDFGMVASMTNISLVPYEMLATGLPLIEFKDGSYETFLGNDTAALVSFDYKDIVNEIVSSINNPSILLERHNYSVKKLSKLSWLKTAEQFKSIIDSCY